MAVARRPRAARDPAWVAEGFVSERWLPMSPVTGRLDAFFLKEPPQAIEASIRAELDADRIIADHDEGPALRLPAVEVTSEPEPIACPRPRPKRVRPGPVERPVPAVFPSPMRR